jgi:methylenetetrahydrofolate reductase (NADPH)
MVDNNVNLRSQGKASHPKLKTPAPGREEPAHVAAELLASGSIEFSNGKPEEIEAVAELLPRGMTVLVPVLHGRTLGSRLELMERLHGAGFDVVPHLAARRISSRDELRGFLDEARRMGALRRVLIIGGDPEHVAGPYADATAVLESGLLQDYGVSEVGFAGYPEGHPRLAAEVIRSALLAKLETASRLGLGYHVITQFSFVPARILEYCAWLSTAAAGTPVYAGVAGPASIRQLVHFARYCGVAASLSAVTKVGVKVAQLTSHMRVDEQLGLLASRVDSRARGSSSLTGIHLFSFGGFTATAQWMRDHITAVA